MANQLKFQIEPHQTNHMMDLENFQNRSSNYFPPMDTGSANIPGRDINRKLFIGGLSRKTTEEDLRAYFSKYGFIDSLKIQIDPKTHISKGFAFIVFSSVQAISKVIAEGDHFINNKRVDTEFANTRQGKIFVGGITAELSKEDIKNHFGQFGNVLEVHIPFGRIKKQKQNYCFVIFDSEKVVEKLIKTPKVYIKNVEVDVKKAIEKSNFAPSGQDIAFPQQGGMEFSQSFEQSLSANNLLLLLLQQMIGTYGYGQQQTYSNPAPIRNNNGGVTQETGRGARRRNTAKRSGRRTLNRSNNTGRDNGASTFNQNFRYQPY